MDDNGHTGLEERARHEAMAREMARHDYNTNVTHDRDRTAEPPRTIAVVATELQNAMDAASRVPRLRAELDALLGVVKRVRKVSK